MLVRSAAALGKKVSLSIDGADVELDREMIELLHDPLVHIVRNAIDHGIGCGRPDDVLAGPESPAEPDGLDTDEQDDSFDPRVVDRVAELTEPADVTDDDAPAASDPPGDTDASPTPAAAADRLLEGKVAPETALLATRAAGSPRGRRFDRAIEEFLEGVAGRRGQSSAIVTSAVELTPEQNERLRAALTKMYGKPVQTNVVIDPSVVGGIKVAVGDDVIDGTIARRLDEARAHLSG